MTFSFSKFLMNVFQSVHLTLSTVSAASQIFYYVAFSLSFNQNIFSFHCDIFISSKLFTHILSNF
jgi:hypothetical protein